MQRYQALLSERGLLPPASIWNAGGRGYPDVSALGYQIPVVLNGQLWPIGGTSASGPIVAGLVSLLNEHRLNHGLPTVGCVPHHTVVHWCCARTDLAFMAGTWGRYCTPCLPSTRRCSTTSSWATT